MSSIRTSKFQTENDEERRRKLSAKILTTYNRVPVIVEKAHPRAPDIQKSKYLAPNDMSVGAFLQEIKRHLVKTDGDKATESIFLFVAANSMPPSNWLMSQVYEKHKNEDGFLYLFYSGENVFG